MCTLYPRICLDGLNYNLSLITTGIVCIAGDLQQGEGAPEDGAEAGDQEVVLQPHTRVRAPLGRTQRRWLQGR